MFEEDIKEEAEKRCSKYFKENCYKENRWADTHDLVAMYLDGYTKAKEEARKNNNLVSQVTKAKEIIKELLKALDGRSGFNEDVFKQAEQFLEEKKGESSTMKPKDKQTLLKKAQSLTLTIGRLLQKEAAADWNSRNKQRLHDAQKAMDVIEACITELACQD